MDRKNNLKAVNRGVQAMLAEGIRVRVDMIIGLPGDTVESVRRGLQWLHDEGITEAQVFNLAVLPGTAFRHEAAELGLRFQPRPPYYVLETPTLKRQDLFELMHFARELFEIDYDAREAPVLEFGTDPDVEFVWHLDLDAPTEPPPADRRAFAFTLQARAERFRPRREVLIQAIRRLLVENPYSTLQVVLEPTHPDESLPADLDERDLGMLMRACLESPTYLDRFYALQPGAPLGAKRLVLLLPARLREALPPAWLDEVGTLATLAWQGASASDETFAEYEYAMG